MASPWDLTALINAADAKASLAPRHLWLVRLMEWLRHAPAASTQRLSAPGGPAPSSSDAPRTQLPVRRLRHLLNQLDAQPVLRGQVQGMLAVFWRDIDAAALFADFGFSSRQSLASEVLERLRLRLLPGTPETTDLASLFSLLFVPGDDVWIEAIDTPTLERLAALLAPGAGAWREMLLEAMTILVSAVHAAGYTPALRVRMDPAAVKSDPFGQLNACSVALRDAVLAGDAGHAEALRQAMLLRALLDACRIATSSVTSHLESHGISVDIVYAMDQMRGRCRRIEQLLNCILTPAPVPEWLRLMASLVRTLAEQSGLRPLLASHYSLLARKVTERSAESGEHYITRSRDDYRAMLRRAAGGGAIIAGTTFVKFAIGALGLTAFWTGFWSGTNYAISFVIVMLLHWTVATKQPAMTAPALAASLPTGGARATDEAIETFVNRVAALIRSQAAGIIGNLAACAPLVLAVQLLCWGVFGAPVVGAATASYVLDSLSLLGPTLFFAAFTGVLLFASSLIAGWAENWFVFHRLDSAIAWNPRIVARLGAARAGRWATWWRKNISGLAANISLGMMLGLVPALASFFALGLEVRHVTLSTGQVAAAAGALGLSVLTLPAFWWCVLAIPLTGLLNVGVSFGLAFTVALRSRGVRLTDRARIWAALRRRLRSAPLSFLWPPPA